MGEKMRTQAYEHRKGGMEWLTVRRVVRRIEDACEIAGQRARYRTLCILRPDNTGQGAQATKRGQTRDSSDPPPGLPPGPTRTWVSNAHLLCRDSLMVGLTTFGAGRGGCACSAMSKSLF